MEERAVGSGNRSDTALIMDGDKDGRAEDQGSKGSGEA